MNWFGRLLRLLKDPPPCLAGAAWGLAALFVAGAFVLIGIGYTAWPVYVVYGGAALFLGYAVYAAVRFAPRVQAGFLARAKKHPFFHNMLTNYGFRTVVFTVLSFTVNIGFAVFNGVLGILASSVWYGILACYYLCLSALRGGILLGSYRAGKRAEGDRRRLDEYKLRLYRLCGVALFVLELALAAAVTLMVLSRRPGEYTEIMAIAAAAYTFYKIIFAIVNVCKVRRLQDPVLQCFRNINLTDAAVSLLSLQVTLVAVFSEGADPAMSALNAVTGFTVCALTIVTGILMIARSSAKLKRFREEKADERTE